MEEHIIELFGIINQYYYSRDYVNYFMNKADGKPIRVKINSLGGDVNQALTISKLFSDNQNVTIEFVGFNASAVTWMAFGAKNIEIHEDAMYLVHKSAVSVEVYGMLNKDQLESKIEELQNKKKSAEAIDLMIASKYVDRSGRDIKEVLELMGENRWMSAAEALEWGFVDKVIPGVSKAANITNEVIENFAAIGLPKPIAINAVSQETGKNIVTQIVEGIKNAFTPKDLSINKNNPMRKDFIAVNQILNLEGIAENEGKIILTSEQVLALNEAITNARNDKQTAIKAQQNAENSYNTAVLALDALSTEVAAASNLDDKIAVIKNVIEKVPGVSVANPSNQGTVSFKEVAVDPINSFEEE